MGSTSFGRRRLVPLIASGQGPDNLLVVLCGDQGATPVERRPVHVTGGGPPSSAERQDPIIGAAPCEQLMVLLSDEGRPVRGRQRASVWPIWSCAAGSTSPGRVKRSRPVGVLVRNPRPTGDGLLDDALERVRHREGGRPGSVRDGHPATTSGAALARDGRGDHFWPSGSRTLTAVFHWPRPVSAVRSAPGSR